MLKPLFTLLLVAIAWALPAQAADPLRVFIRSGAKTHGPGQHDHPRFLAEWTKLLNDRGATATGAERWPTPEEFAKLDVVIVFAPDPWDVPAATRAAIDKFAERGGGFVVLHDGVCSHSDPAWVRSLIGGAWRYGAAKYFEGDLDFYYVRNDDPIVAGASNFTINDEMYYDLDMHPEADVLAATWTPDARAQQNGRAFPSIYNVAPQMWSFDDHSHRAFVDLLGHNYTTLEQPQVRAVLLRGLAWTAQRKDLNEFCSKEELASLRYPPGGPSRPEDELAKLEVHPGFTATLQASEPLVNKVIALDWDPSGRLWVAETPEYPNGRRGLRPDFAGAEWKDHGGLVPEAGKQVRPGRDRISMLTNAGGAGAADHKEVFYEGLELVTGFVFHRDGVIVCAAPDILWLRDTKGTGKADTVVKLYTGLGTRDTHAVINNLRWGYDGWIYATHGYSQSDHVTSGDGAKDFGRIGSGVIRFRPDGSAIEQYSSKGGNTWGLAVTPENRIIWTQPTSGDLVMETVLPETVLARGKVGDTASFKVITKSGKTFPLMTWEQQAYRQIDWVGSFTAAAGCAIYDGGTWPAKWNGSYFTGEPTINLVHHEFFAPDGVSYAGSKEPGREETEFMRSKDMWFRPIDERIGPDGALYVVDFYNQAVIHNDTRGPVHNEVNAAVRPDRDHYFSRVWRVDSDEAKALPVPDLAKADGAQLLAALESPNRAVRFTSQRLLLEKGEVPVPPLLALAGDAQKPAPTRLHALWILQLAGQLEEPALLAAVRAADPVVAQNALKIVAERAPAGPELITALAARLADPDPRTQLAGLVALSSAEPTPELCRALLAVVPSLKDPFLQSAAVAGASRAPGEYLTAALALPGDFQPELAAFLGRLSHLVAGQPAAAAKLLTALSSPELPVARALPILTGLSEESRSAKAPAWTPELQTAFTQLLARPELQGTAVTLALAWDKEGLLRPAIAALVGNLLRQLTDASQPEPARAALVTTLASARSLSPEILPAISRLLGTEAPATLQKHALAALGETDDAASGAALVAAFPKLTPILQGEAFAQILRRGPWTQLFVEKLKTGEIPLLSVGTIAMDKLRHYPNGAIARAASETLDALRGPVTQQKDGLIAKLLPVVENGGDSAKGKQLFLSTCAVCHHFNGEGANLAPDLTGMGAHPRAELLTDIVDPNREVDPSFIAWDFQMANGEAFQGIIARENARTVLVRDAAGEHQLEKANIAGRHELGRSLMPEGFEALGGETLRDIVAYLQSGDARFRVLDLRKACTADSRQAIFTADHVGESLKFKKFGDVRVGDVPFTILDPASAGKNLIILKGGEAPLAKSYPRRVEILAGRVEANVLEILGGIGGWAFPCCGDEKGEGIPVVKVTVEYVGGATEEMELRNGIEIADYIRPHDVPGSRSAAELVNGQQVRVIRKTLSKGGAINKIILESLDTRVAPVFVAITAEKTDARPAPGTAAAN